MLKNSVAWKHSGNSVVYSLCGDVENGTTQQYVI